MSGTLKIFLLTCLVVVSCCFSYEEAIAGSSHLVLSQWSVGQVATGECLPPPPSLDGFQTLSTVGLVAGFIFVFLAILLDNKKLKATCWALALIPFGMWGYANFLVDYNGIQKSIFNLDAMAEQTLSNIAEAQDRFKSEQDIYIKDLTKVKSHLAGAHGLDECVRILELNVAFDHWDAAAKHISSPNVVRWDSTSGSSLKKG